MVWLLQAYLINKKVMKLITPQYLSISSVVGSQPARIPHPMLRPSDHSNLVEHKSGHRKSKFGYCSITIISVITIAFSNKSRVSPRVYMKSVHLEMLHFIKVANLSGWIEVADHTLQGGVQSILEKICTLWCLHHHNTTKDPQNHQFQTSLKSWASTELITQTNIPPPSLPPLLHVQLSGAFFQVRNLLDGGLSREYFYQSSTHECRVVRYSLSTLSLLE